MEGTLSIGGLKKLLFKVRLVLQMGGGRETIQKRWARVEGRINCVVEKKSRRASLGARCLIRLNWIPYVRWVSVDGRLLPGWVK